MKDVLLLRMSESHFLDSLQLTLNAEVIRPTLKAAYALIFSEKSLLSINVCVLHESLTHKGVGLTALN